MAGTTVLKGLGRSEDIAFVVVNFLASRLALFVVGMLTQIYISPYSTMDRHVHWASRSWVNMWAAWDSEWYSRLADTGYTMNTTNGQHDWGFFPLYPFSAKAISLLIHVPPMYVMVAVSNICFFCALFVIFDETRREFSAAAAKAAVSLLCIVPGTYIFSAAYTEGMFVLWFALTLFFARRRKWMLAGLAAALAALTRNIGIFVGLPILIAGVQYLVETRPWMKQADGRLSREGLASTGRLLVGLALPALAILGFCLYLYFKTGHFLAYVEVEKEWGRKVENPIGNLIKYALHPGDVADPDFLNLFAALLTLPLMAVLAVKRMWALLLLGVILSFVALSTGLMGYARYTLVMLPFLMAAAAVCARHPLLARTAYIVLAMTSGFMMVAWTLQSTVVL